MSTANWRIGDHVTTITADEHMGRTYRIVAVDAIADIWKLRPIDPSYDFPPEAVRYVRGDEIMRTDAHQPRGRG